MSRIQNPKSKIQNPLIVALDVSTAKQAREIFAELGETGCAFKIGLQLFTVAGSSFVRELVKAGAKIFLDLKFHDIPNTVASAAVEAAKLGVWMFNVHASGGREMMQRTAEAVREIAVKENLPVPKIIAVTILTSSTAETLREVGIESELVPQVLRLAKAAEDSGLDGVVASAQEAREIKVESEKRKVENDRKREFLIVTPGIRLLSALDSPLSVVADDQKRILSAQQAIENGADYLVVGRPILTASNKIETVREILREIELATESANL